MRGLFIASVGIVLGLSCAPEEQAKKDKADPVLPTTTDRMVLHEVFTGCNCGPCFGADALLDAVFEENPERFTTIKYQVGSDPYMTSESVARRMYYLPGEDVYAIPYVHADGVYGFHPAEVNEEEGYNEGDLDAFAAEAAVLLLSVAHSISGKTVDFTVDYTALADIPSDDLILHAVIIENKTFLNVGTNGQSEFHQVMKKMVPDGAGTPIAALVREDTGSISLSYTFNGEYDDETSRTDMVDHSTAHTVEEFDDLEVVVFLQDAVTWEVFQSAWTID